MEVYLVRRLRSQAQMWASGIIKLEVTPDLVSGSADRLVSVKVNVLVLERTPQPLDEDVVRPTAAAISNHRLVALEDGNVTFRWRDSAHGNKKKLMKFPVDEFLRRFLLHLLPRGFVRIRHFGFLANRRRARLLPVCFELLHRSTERAAPAKAVSPSQKDSTWRCHLCGGSMRIVERISAAQLLLRSPPKALRCAT